MKKFAKILSLTLIFVLASFVFTACVPSDVESAKEKMEEAGYVVIDYSDNDADNEEGIIGGISATKINSLTSADGIIALYFESSKKAKEYAEKWEDSKYDVVEHSGKWAFAGTEKAVEDFKK